MEQLVAYLVYKVSKTCTAVERWAINIVSRQLTAHEESGSNESPGQYTHRSDDRPVRVIGEGLLNRARRGDCESSERVQRNCGDKRDDPPREENQWQRHHNASPLLCFVRDGSACRVEIETHRKHHEAFTTHVHNSSFDISFITEEGNYRRDHTSNRAENCHEPCNSS